MHIHEAIIEARVGEICDPQTGDCVSVAVAIQRVFGGTYVCGYQSPDDLTPAHATVELDKVLYDGCGRTSLASLYDMTTSGLKESEIGEYQVHIGQPSQLTNNQNYDKRVMKQVKTQLESAVEQIADR